MSSQFDYQLADRARTLEAVAVYNLWGAPLTGPEGNPERISDISRDAVARVAPPPATLAAAVRTAVGEIDPNLAVSDVRSLEDILDRAAAQMAFTMTLIIIAASVALMLGVVGIYGVTSHIVSQRTSEIGVRLALGAEPGQVAGMIVRQGGCVAVAGVIVGLDLAYAGSRFIASLLYGVSAPDLAVFAATTVMLLTVGWWHAGSLRDVALASVLWRLYGPSRDPR